MFLLLLVVWFLLLVVVMLGFFFFFFPFYSKVVFFSFPGMFEKYVKLKQGIIKLNYF